MSETSGRRQPDGRERIARIQDALRKEDLDAVLCTVPSLVLMATGYWPVIGTAISIVTRDGVVVVLTPEDELEYAQHSWAHRIWTFRPSTLDRTTTPAIEAAQPLRNLLHEMKLNCARIGYEYGSISEPATYAGMHLYASDVVDMLRTAAPSAALAPANGMLARLSASKTPPEVDRVRTACRVAAKSFEQGCAQIVESAPETAIAAAYRAGFSIHGMAVEDVLRADGFAWCMAGPNSAKAGGAFAYSTDRRLKRQDLVLVHANSYLDGYWTDITRTQVLGEPDAKQRQLLEVIREARQSALAKIRPGARAAEVDLAAREVLCKHGFEKEFTHSTGHGIGFASISANARPRIHPKSDEILETGMTFNIEPAIYIAGYGGVRHCDMVTVVPTGVELLTDF